MTTRRGTTMAQRHEFVHRHRAGQTYPGIAEDTGWSQWRVRDWCRQAQARAAPRRPHPLSARRVGDQ